MLFVTYHYHPEFCKIQDILHEKQSKRNYWQEMMQIDLHDYSCQVRV